MDKRDIGKQTNRNLTVQNIFRRCPLQFTKFMILCSVIFLSFFKIRNGPGRIEVGKRSFQNLFDGFAKVHSWQFPGNGSSFFTSRFIQSESYNESLRLNDIALYETLDALSPPLNSSQQKVAFSRGMDNMNVNVYNYSGDCVIVNDYWKLYQIDCHSLDAVRSVTPKIPGEDIGFPYASKMSVAHPVREYGTENHLTILQKISMLPVIPHKITLVRIKSAGIREKIAEWSVKKMPYLHSFSVTERYAVILACPFYVNMGNIIKGFTPMDSMIFDKDKPSTAYIVNLSTGKVMSIETETVFSMHHVNAYELDDDTIVMDVAAFPDASVMPFFEFKILMNKTRRDAFPYKPFLRRYRIDLKGGKMIPFSVPVNPSLPHVNTLDLPTLNEHYRSKHYCYVYGITFKSDFKTWGNFSFVKKDMCNASRDLSWSLPGHYPMEGWFVPNPNGSAEDDGVLIVPVFNGNIEKTYLMILDPKTMKPLTKAYLPVGLLFHFHGRFFENLH
jgi:carotenoid cleavage dioxygenase-like enzyme